MPLRFPLLGRRLSLRPFTVTDFEAAHGIYSDADVMRFVAYGRPSASLAETRAMVSAYIDHQKTHDHGFWAVIETATGRLIGDAGFESGDGADVDFGYTLEQRSWGRGYATEAAEVCLAAIEELVERERIVSHVDPANRASARVLEKVGFLLEGTRILYGRPHLSYRLAN